MINKKRGSFTWTSLTNKQTIVYSRVAALLSNDVAKMISIISDSSTFGLLYLLYQACLTVHKFFSTNFASASPLIGNKLQGFCHKWLEL